MGFALGDCNERIDRISMDWVYFELSRTFYGDTNTALCGNISHTEIRELCEDSAIDYEDAISSI
jgi:hypothetical protein